MCSMKSTPLNMMVRFMQIYMAVMAMLRGHELLKIEKPLVAKDVTLSGEKSNSYRDNIQRSWKGDLSAVTGGMPQVIDVFFDAIDRSNVDDALLWNSSHGDQDLFYNISVLVN